VNEGLMDVVVVVVVVVVIYLAGHVFDDVL
jgi:hypothetical protein